MEKWKNGFMDLWIYGFFFFKIHFFGKLEFKIKQNASGKQI
jgi:hypothetical protein